MLNRATNLLVLLVILGALLLLAIKLNIAWHATEPWELEWNPKSGTASNYSAHRLTQAIRQASAAHAINDVVALKKELEAHFEPSTIILTRFSSGEIFGALFSGAVTLVGLIVPVCLNYVRHGRFRLWNNETRNDIRIAV